MLQAKCLLLVSPNTTVKAKTYTCGQAGLDRGGQGTYHSIKLGLECV